MVRMITPDGRSEIEATFGRPAKSNGMLNEAWEGEFIRKVAPVYSKKSILRMKTAFIDCVEANFLFVVAICIVLS
jgi:hypothetical protein